jgi:hypothetical protein
MKKKVFFAVVTCTHFWGIVGIFWYYDIDTKVGPGRLGFLGFRSEHKKIFNFICFLWSFIFSDKRSHHEAFSD